MDVPSAATCHVCTPQLLRVTQAFGHVMDVPSAATCHVCTPQLLRVTQAFGYVMDVPHFSLVDKWSNQLIGAFAMWMAQAAPVVVIL